MTRPFKAPEGPSSFYFDATRQRTPGRYRDYDAHSNLVERLDCNTFTASFLNGGGL